ncbi:lamin tail domain-containing protein [Candidatus Saccharibacteria bacterium]|nr:lamin tail domain-containing protein [Candidatus Saccharibacteria bacterium]MCB9820964.1 lamin tail domain-containing protein [Candidatus Nomurabacteria bacterium]
MKKIMQAMLIAFSPLFCYAPVHSESVSQPATIWISEVQTEGEAALDEMIEIYNPGDGFFNMEGYEIVYVSASGSTTSLEVDLTGWLAPRSYIFFVREEYPDPDASGFLQKASGMAASGGHVVVRSEDEAIELDRLGWGTAVFPETQVAITHTNTTSLQRINFANTLEPVDPACDGVTDPMVPVDPATEPAPGLNCEDPSLAYTDEELVQLIDTNDNSFDFMMLEPTPLNTNTDPPEVPEDNTGDTPPVEDVLDTSTDPTNPDDAFLELAPVVINELLPDPASPVTDAEGEFVELYNPNTTNVNLDGIVMQMGSTYSRKLPLDGITLKPQQYLAIYSGQANISLANSGSSVRLVLPSGKVWGAEVSYPKVKTSEAYALFDGVWRFTSMPTPNKPNVYRASITVVKSASKKSTSKKTSVYVDPAKFNIFKPIIITELLPDPASPVKDSEGEFIELYNPNNSKIDLRGLIVQTGSNFSYSHTFSSGSIGPGEYIVLYSKDTSLTLSNSGGAARLLLPNGEQWGDVVTYDEAETGESYALIDGVWQWTSLPTPATKNELVEIVNQATNDTESSNSSQFSSVYREPPKIESSLTSWLMVGGLGLATLLYSGYEYRRDIAHKIWQYRTNRATSK